MKLLVLLVLFISIIIIYADPEFDFQILKGRADARLRGLDFFGGTCVAAAFRNGDGIVQLSQCVSHNFFRGFCV